MVCLEEVSITLVVYDSKAAINIVNFKQSCCTRLFTNGALLIP